MLVDHDKAGAYQCLNPIEDLSDEYSGLTDSLQRKKHVRSLKRFSSQSVFPNKQEEKSPGYLSVSQGQPTQPTIA